MAAQGNAGLKELLKIIAGERDARLPVDAHASLVVLAAGLHAVQTMIGSIDKRIMIEHRSNEASKRLRSIPGIGIVGASAIVATVTDPIAFRSGRDFAAWIGLVPRQESTGGKQKLGPISKQGDRYVRRILVVGAHAVLALRRDALLRPRDAAMQRPPFCQIVAAAFTWGLSWQGGSVGDFDTFIAKIRGALNGYAALRGSARHHSRSAL